MFKTIILLAVLFHSLTGLCEEILKIPYRPDPPISIDGKLEEWSSVPFLKKMNSKKQVIFLAEGRKWNSAKDLSGEIRLSWRPEGLFIAAQVKDDKFTNSGPGDKMFHGDHLELFFDATPDKDSKRNKFGKNQFQFTISPGNLNDDRPVGSFGRIDPEMYRFSPSSKSVINAMVAARKTNTGWNLEALIPWDEFGIKNPRNGKRLKLEITISDSDSVICKQEKMMAMSSAKWKFKKRDRLLPAVLADSNGKAVIIKKLKSIKLIKQAVIKSKNYIEKKFNMPELPEDVCPVLFIKSRLDSPKNNGDTFAMNVYLNGKMVHGKRMMKKSVDMKTLKGGMLKIYSKASYGFRVPYASSYKEANLPLSAGNRYARFASKEPRTDFFLDISGLVKTGENVLKIGHLHPAIKTDMHIADVQIFFKPAKAKRKKVLDKAVKYFSPKTASGKLKYKQQAGSKIVITTDKVSFSGKSYFSIPGGRWVTASNKYFSLDRKIKKQDGVIVVEDNFTNLTDKNLGIMQRHEFKVYLPKAKFYINGVPRSAKTKGYYSSYNGTSFAGASNGGIGIAALNDAFKIHAENYLTSPNGIGLCDRLLVVGPKASYTAKWVIAANSNGSYWDFINTMRRFLKVNFLINGPVAMLRSYPPYSDWSIPKISKFFKEKSAFFGIGGMTHRSTYEGKKLPYLFNHGRAIRLGIPQVKKVITKWRKAAPKLKILNYYHCFIDSSDNAGTDFADSKILDYNGTPAVYGKYYYKLFYPTLTNKFGKESEKTIDMLFDILKIDGIFWDEISYSMVPYLYGKPWDKCSGDIDMKTHEIVKLKSSVSLISKPWRVKQAKKILSKGYLLGNGSLYCEDMRKLKIPCFTETAQSIFCARTHLYTPISLGDHLSEATEQDAYTGMLKALDYGCVYYWYGDRVYATYKTLTDKMYPITPVRLGPGFIIGKERILTRVSGFFGWNDASEHEVYFFNEKGMQVKKQKITTKLVDGKRFSEINLWPDWSAAIVKKQAK
jgi:cellulose/xylan binding protein with CBM9 domain